MPRNRWMLILACTLLLGIFLRFYKLDLVEFKGDEAMACQSALDFRRTGHFPQAGLPSSVGIENFPGFIYLVSIPAAISTDPEFIVGFIAFLNCAAILLCFWIVRRFYSDVTAVVAALLFASSPWAVFNSRKIWAQDVLPFFTMLLMTSLLLWANGRRRQLALAFLWLAVLIQLHFSALYLLPALVIFIAVFRHRVDPAVLALGLVLFASTFFPYLYRDYILGFRNLAAFWSLAIRPPSYSLDSLRFVLDEISSFGYSALAGESIAELQAQVLDLGWLNKLESAAFLGGAALTIWRIPVKLRQGVNQALSDPSFQADLLLSLWFLAPVLLQIRHSTPVHQHYLVIAYPAQFIAIARLVDAAVNVGRYKVSQVLWLGSRSWFWRALKLTVLALVAVTASSQAYVTLHFFSFLETHSATTTYGVPLRYLKRVARSVDRLTQAEQRQVTILSQGDDGAAHRLRAVLTYLRGSGATDQKLRVEPALVMPNQSGSRQLYLTWPGGHNLDLLPGTLSALAVELADEAVFLPGGKLAFRFYIASDQKTWGRLPTAQARGWPLRLQNGVELLAVSYDRRAEVGSVLSVSYLWRVASTSTITEGETVFFTHLTDRSWQVLGAQDRIDWPRASWQPGDVVLSWNSIPVSLRAPLSQGWILLGMYSTDTLERERISDAQGLALGDSLRLGPIKVVDKGFSQRCSGLFSNTRLNAMLGDKILLIGANLPRFALHPGQVAAISLHWQAVNPPVEDFTVFVHLLDRNGRIVAQDDGEPRGDLYPTSLWDGGECVEDPRQLTLPRELPAGQYQVVAGMYDRATGVRLSVREGPYARGSDLVSVGSLNVVAASSP